MLELQDLGGSRGRARLGGPWKALDLQDLLDLDGSADLQDLDGSADLVNLDGSKDLLDLVDSGGSADQQDLADLGACLAGGGGDATR